MGVLCSDHAGSEESTLTQDVIDQDSLVKSKDNLGMVIDVKPVIPMSGRYTRMRKLDQDYVLDGRVLGSGMSGDVKLASNKEDGRKYAIKSFSKQGLPHKTVMEIKNEAELYLTLDHPHITRLEMVYEDGDMLHLVMEHMAGGELWDRLAASKQYTEETAGNTIHQMLLAVAYLHARNIAHRDLKLENFLYERPNSEHLKLIDFGFAKCWADHTPMTQSCGSLLYIAPEVLRKSYTVQADMWSLGIVSYMLLLGSAPFQGSDRDIFRNIKSGRVRYSSRFPRLSTRAQNFVQSLLVFDPRTRLSAQKALEHEWIMGRKQASQQAIDVSILTDLRNFTRASHFQRAILSMAAWSLSSEDATNLREQFLLMDRSKSGKLTCQDLKVIFENNCQSNTLDVATVFRSLPADCDKELEYSDFLSAALLGRVTVHDEMLRKTFARFDQDGSGLISKAELHSVLGGSFNELEITDMIRDVDTSGDGEIDYYEFMSYFQDSKSGDGNAVAHPRQPLGRKRKTEELGVVIDQMLEATNPRAVAAPMEKRQQAWPSSCFSMLFGAKRSVTFE